MSWCGGGEIRPTPGRREADLRDVRVDLVAGQLAALAGLRALRHLDLELVGVREVVDVDAEAAGGDLLDRRAARVAVRVADVAHRVLAALAGVRLAAEPVHRDRERLVRLARERAERHRAGREALDDLGRRLDLLERDRRAAVLKREQPAQRRPPRRVLVHELRELLVGRVAAVAHRVLEQRDRLRVPLVVLAVVAPGVDAAEREQVAVRAGRRARGGRAPPARAPSVPIPPIRDGVPVKWRSTSAVSRPTASKICAPQ